VIYGRDAIVAESVHPLGQGGMIDLAGQLDPHFADQLELFHIFQYKPMLLMQGP